MERNLEGNQEVESVVGESERREEPRRESRKRFVVPDGEGRVRSVKRRNDANLKVEDK